jgi:sugar phosphate isomerase/epimerase
LQKAPQEGAQELMQDPISVQMYSLRKLGSLERELTAVAEAGYRNVELIGTHLAEAAVTRRALAGAGLAVSSAHVSLMALRERFDLIMEACKALGLSDLYMPAVPPEQRKSPPPFWSALGHELGRMAERSARQDINLGYHNHDWELKVGSDGRDAFSLLFEAAGSAPLFWQVDVAWLARGGADPAAVIRRHAARINAAHVKDLAPAGTKLDEDGWADVGAGTLDWRALWPECRRMGARWMVVEHDNPADPALSVRNSLQFIRAIETNT